MEPGGAEQACGHAVGAVSGRQGERGDEIQGEAPDRAARGAEVGAGIRRAGALALPHTAWGSGPVRPRCGLSGMPGGQPWRPGGCTLRRMPQTHPKGVGDGRR